MKVLKPVGRLRNRPTKSQNRQATNGCSYGVGIPVCKRICTEWMYPSRKQGGCPHPLVNEKGEMKIISPFIFIVKNLSMRLCER